MKTYRIAVDAMGGDNAPDAIVKGTIAALRKFEDIEVLLAGKPEAIKPLLMEAQDVRSRVEILPASEVITMDEAPMMAVRKKTDSSLVQAMLAVREKRADALVSAGSTGAVLAGSIFRIGRINGIERPALATVIPGVEKPFLLLDCGANVDCQPRYLNQFAMMGAVYMQRVMNVKEPSVGLVNIGTEAEKGNKLAKETYALMSEQTAYHFAGNCEARDIPSGKFDVVVADGFDGNIILKYTEGLAKSITGMLKQNMMSSWRTKLGALLAKPAFVSFKRSMDYNAYGGAPLLGVDGAVIKAHGSSGEEAIMNAIRQACGMLVNELTERIREGLEGLTEINA